MLLRLGSWFASRLHQMANDVPDRGDESVNKILWAGAIVALVTIVGAIFRDTIVDAFNNLQIGLGFEP